MTISPGVDAVKDKFDEKKSEVSKDANKNAAEHEAKGLVETMKEKAAEAYVKNENKIQSNSSIILGIITSLVQQPVLRVLQLVSLVKVERSLEPSKKKRLKR